MPGGPTTDLSSVTLYFEPHIYCKLENVSSKLENVSSVAYALQLPVRNILQHHRAAGCTEPLNIIMSNILQHHRAVGCTELLNVIMSNHPLKAIASARPGQP